MFVTVEPVALPLIPSEGRSPGVHLSALIRGIAIEEGILKDEWVEELALADTREITDPVACLRMSMGLAWEAWYVPTHLTNVLGQPGEMCRDGIYMTPDGEELDILYGDKWGIRLHEVKLTYKSTKTVGVGNDKYGPMEGQWMWLAQAKGYCKGKGTRFVTFHVLFVCGDYSYPIQPRLLRFHIEFTQYEIDSNWELMTAYRDHRLAMEAA